MGQTSSCDDLAARSRQRVQRCTRRLLLMSDLLVCRPELASTITAFVKRYWAEHGQT
jgi:hypothetical protein